MADSSDHAIEMELLKARVRELEALINTPQTDDWLKAVRLEAGHQIDRWGVDHDHGKRALDWFWLLGFLGQKAAYAAIASDTPKALHHTISAAAMLLNWHRHLQGVNTPCQPGADGVERHG
jgi:hypothetical protein